MATSLPNAYVICYCCNIIKKRRKGVFIDTITLKKVHNKSPCCCKYIPYKFDGRSQWGGGGGARIGARPSIENQNKLFDVEGFFSHYRGLFSMLGTFSP